MTQQNPLVTVYIPTFNRVKLLERAVSSVRNQTYENLEIIIVDDCSNDGTHEYLKQLAKSDSRIKYYIKHENSGACISRNIAIREATGLFITGLDDDDYFDRNRIEIFIKEALKDENKLYFTKYRLKLSSGKFSSPSVLSNFKKSTISYPQLIKKNPIGNQVFIKTKFLQGSGGFDQNMLVWQDLECWYNLLKTQNINAKFIKKTTQTVDISHEHERISTQKIDKIIKSYNYFVSKHSLNSYQRFILKGQIIRYNPDEYSKSEKFITLLLTGNYFLLKNLLGLN